MPGYSGPIAEWHPITQPGFIAPWDLAKMQAGGAAGTGGTGGTEAPPDYGGSPWDTGDGGGPDFGGDTGFPPGPPPYNPWPDFTGSFGNKGVLSETPGFGKGGGNWQPTPFGAGEYQGPPKLELGTGGKGAGQQAAGGAQALAKVGGGKQPNFQQMLQMLQALMSQLGITQPGAPNVPDFSAEAIRAAEEERRRRGLIIAQEAAATGSAGDRDVAYRQSLLDEALNQSVGNIKAEQLSRQYAAELARYAAQQRYVSQLWSYLMPLVQMFAKG